MVAWLHVLGQNITAGGGVKVVLVLGRQETEKWDNIGRSHPGL